MATMKRPLLIMGEVGLLEVVIFILDLAIFWKWGWVAICCFPIDMFRSLKNCVHK